MNTFLIYSKDKENSKQKALEIAREQKISDFDTTILEFEKAMGISDVRKIQEKIFLKPLKSEKKAVIVITNSSATVEAQNSMLKLLEEPPTNTLIFITTNDLASFLPTIISRVKVIAVEEEPSKNQTENNNLEKVLSLQTVGERMKLAQDLAKEKADAISWLEQAILQSRAKMIESVKNNSNEGVKFQNLITKLEAAHSDLKNTNANPRLLLENLFLNL